MVVTEWATEPITPALQRELAERMQVYPAGKLIVHWGNHGKFTEVEWNVKGPMPK